MLSIRRRNFCGNNPDFDKQSDFLRQESAAARRNLPLSVFQGEKTKGGIRLAAADCHFRRKKSAGDPASAVRDGRALGYKRGGGRGSGRAAAENGALGCAAAGQPSAGRRRFPVGNAVSGSAAVSPKGAGAVAGRPPPGGGLRRTGGKRRRPNRGAAVRACQKAAAVSGSGSPGPNRAGGGTLSGCAGHAPGMEGTELCGLVPVPPGSRPRAGSAARQPAVRGMRQSLRGQRRSGGALPSRRRGGRVHHGQYPQHRALLRRDHRPGQGQAHQPGLSDGSRRAASLTP